MLSRRNISKGKTEYFDNEGKMGEIRILPGLLETSIQVVPKVRYGIPPHAE
jgi:hypothetical protein